MRQQKKRMTTAKKNIQQLKRLDGRTGNKLQKESGSDGSLYIQNGQASHVQENKEWNLEETIREVKQKCSTDMKMIAMETTNDDKLLKILVCLKRKTTTQIPDEYKQYTKNPIQGNVLRQQNNSAKKFEKHVITILHKGHPSINKISRAAKPFWWPRMNKEIQQKCDECIPCKMTGKNIEPQLPMTEVNYLPPTKKPNEEIQWDFIGPIRFKKRRFFILVSIDRYSSWPAACVSDKPTGKTAKSFLEQYINLNGIPQTIRTDKSTAFTGKEFSDIC